MLWLLLTLLGAPESADPMAAFLDKLAAKREAIQQVTTDFYQVTLMPDDEMTATGSIAYAHPRQLAVRFQDPELHYLLGDRQVVEYDAELSQVQMGDLADAPEIEVLFAGFGQSSTRLTEAYDLSLFTPEDGPKDAQGLELRPKNGGQGDELFERARLYLRAEDLLPYRIEVVNGEDSRVIYDISNIQTARPLAEDALKIHVPEGVRIIQNETLRETVGPGGKDITLAAPSPAVAESGSE